MLKELLEELCRDLELKMPKIDDKKVYGLEVVPGMVVEMKELEPGVRMEGKLGEFMKEKREDLCMELMQANLLGRGTGGAVIGLDNDEKFLTLSLALAYEMNYRIFKEYLEDFVNYLIYWRDEIEKIKTEAQKIM